jgi:hypothetical protein
MKKQSPPGFFDFGSSAGTTLVSTADSSGFSGRIFRLDFPQTCAIIENSSEKRLL